MVNKVYSGEISVRKGASLVFSPILSWRYGTSDAFINVLELLSFTLTQPFARPATYPRIGDTVICGPGTHADPSRVF